MNPGCCGDISTRCFDGKLLGSQFLKAVVIAVWKLSCLVLNVIDGWWVASEVVSADGYCILQLPEANSISVWITCKLCE